MAIPPFKFLWSYLSKSLSEFGAILSPYITSGNSTYKVYSALLTQSGTDSPTAVVLENTLGVTPTWGYQNVGIYRIDSIGTFIDGKTTITVGPLAGNTWGEVTQSYYEYPDTLFILTARINVDNNMPQSLERQDDLLNKTFVEIRVYN